MNRHLILQSHVFERNAPNAGGGKTASILTTIMSSAHRHGHNEIEYLCNILSRLVDWEGELTIRNLLFDRWKPRAA